MISHHLRFFRPIALLAVASSIASATVIHKNDDTILTGDLQSISNGKLTLSVNNAPVVVGLDEISQITIKEPPVPVVAKPAAPMVQNDADEGPNLGGALFGALFSGAHKQNTPTIETKPVPVSLPAPTTQAASTKPFVGPNVQITLTDGDQFHARLDQWSDQKLRLHLSDETPIQFSSSVVTQIWLGTTEQQNKARALLVDPGPEDVAFVSKDNDIVAVKGLVQGIVGDALQFRYADQDRKIGLSKVVGLLLRSNAASPLAGFHQLVHADNGDRFSGNLTGLDHDSMIINMLDTPVKIPISSITTIDFINGQVTSLCDLKPSRVEQAAYFGRLMGYQVDKSLTGGPLVLSDGPASRGIAVHSRCVLQYEVPPGIDRFRTKLGFSQPEGLSGRVVARVLGDGNRCMRIRMRGVTNRRSKLMWR